MASLNTHETRKGLRLKFKDVECFRDYVMENSDDYEYDTETRGLFDKWKPINETLIAKEEKSKPSPSKHVVDSSSDDYALLLGLRSHKSTAKNDMEQLDFSNLDYLDSALLHTDVIQNSTHLEFEIDDNNLTTKAVQNQSTMESVTKLSLELSHDDAILSGTNSVTTNPSNFSLLQNNESEIISKKNSTSSSLTEQINPLLSTQALKTHEENVTGQQILEFSMLTSVEEVDDEENSEDNIFIYSVPALNSQISIKNDKYIKDIVLLDNGEEIETSPEHLIEYNVSHIELPEKPTMDVLGNTTQTTWIQEVQELNNTNMKSLNELNREPNHSRVVSDPPKVIQQINSTQVHYQSNQVSNKLFVEEDIKVKRAQKSYKYSEEENKVFNSTHMDPEVPVEEIKVLNSTQVDPEVLVEEIKVFNSTQVDPEVLVEEIEVFNSTQVNPEVLIEEIKVFNSTQVDPEVLVEEIKVFNSTQVEPEVLVKEIEVFNSTQVDPEILVEEIKVFNSTHVDSEVLVEENKVLNSTKVESDVPVEDNEVFNSTQLDSEVSIDENKQLNITQINLESNFSYANILQPGNSSEEVTPDPEKSLNDVVIYLKDSNNTMVILSTHLDSQSKNWSYDSKHELVPMEFSDHIDKYITDKQPNSAKEKKKKIHLQRVKPIKGYGMKTKKKKEYKPQLRSDISPRGFSPRGFGPQLTPRTARLNFSEEDMMPKPIVIGIHRNDFDEYEIYVPRDEQVFDFDNTPDDKEEYEYVEYKDPYGKPAQTQTDVLDEATKYSLQMAGSKSQVYFITAEEVNWDYVGYGQRREDKSSVKERPTIFKKVMFRLYLDSSFTTPDYRGEVDEHLGIMGPLIKAEVDETIYIVFKNLASRPYSLHANGVSYKKNMEGLNYEDNSPYWYKYDNAVEPNTTFTYIWTVNDKVGPLHGEPDCRIWTYYSGVNPERDIHSGLIGPLLICRKGTLAKTPVDTQEFILLFMTFDENKSWYYEQNREIFKKTNRKAIMDPNFNNSIKFHAINGIIYSLKGLRMYSNQLVNWHLINMGSPKDFQSIHFHGQTFINKHNDPHRQGVYPLLPGDFVTLQMWPSKPGLWMLESEVGISHQRGMQTLFLVLDNVCSHSLGLTSGAIKDSQITASHSRGYWLPSLARLHNTGKYNAWSTVEEDAWIQVDFQRPVVISKIATQGAKQLFTSHFVLNYTIFYSTDRKKWSWYKGDSKTYRKIFEGNRDAYKVKENIFFPPLISRYVRLYPSHSYNYPTVRMEFYGCELDGCSVPLGMQNEHISDQQITASSVATNWFSGKWQPYFARLDKQGSLNAWQAKGNDMHPWLQIKLKDVKKITGIVTQGAKSLNTEMFVTTFILEYSDDGMKWTKYSDNEDYEIKTFVGNSDNYSHVKNYIYPPIFSKFIRIIPTKWQNAATMRVELLGCDF